MNFNDVLKKRLELFPSRVRIERKSASYNASGQKMGDAWSAVEGFEAIPAQSAPPRRGSGGETIRGEATHALTQKIWTLPGEWIGIASSQRLTEVDKDDNSIVLGSHDILAVDVHEFGLHTIIETKRAT